MKFELLWASSANRHRRETIEINTLEELKALQEREGSQLIVNFRVPAARWGSLSKELPEIWIYDDYME